MLKQLCKDFRLHLDSLWIMVLSILGGLAGGMVLVCIIMNVDSDPGSWFCMGTVFAGLVGVVFLLIYGAFGYNTEFQLALAMGCTRRHFMVSYFLRALVKIVLVYVLTLLGYRLETALYPGWFPAYENELAFSFLFNRKILLPIAVGLAIVPMFLGSLYSRYGKKGMAVFYIVWLFCCFVLPRMFDDHPGSGILDQAASGLKSFIHLIPAPVWIVLGLAAAAAMSVATVIFGRTQQVKL